jgi:uncharacterized protein
MRRSSLIVLCVSLGLLCLPATAQRDRDTPDFPTLTVSGTGEVRVPPDFAIVRLGVTRRAATAGEAQDQVNSTAQQILTSFQGMELSKDAIQTSQLTLSPVFGSRPQDQNETPRIAGYTASNVVTVRVERLASVGPIVDAALRAGSNELQGVSFGLRNEVPARERAIRLAVQEARDKATALANELGVRLVGLVEVNEGGVFVRPFQTAGGFAMARESAATPVSPGEVTVQASLTLRYRLAGR